MTISAKGRLTSYTFYEAVMSSHARLTYNKVWHILQGDQDLREQYAPLVKHIEELHNLYKVLDASRAERGGISLRAKKRSSSSTPSVVLSALSKLSVMMPIN